MGKKRSDQDQGAIFQHAFNDELGALEVVVVGADLKVDSMTQNVTVDTSKMEEQLQVLIASVQKQKDFEASRPQVMAPEIKTINVPTIITETKIQIVEVPVIVEKIVVKEVEVVREVQIPGPTKIEVVQVTVDREVVVTKTEYKDLSKLLIAGLALQGLIQILTVLLHK